MGAKHQARLGEVMQISVPRPIRGGVIKVTDELIHDHLHYAHAIAAELARKYPPNIPRADLEGAAELGLVQAARSYDPARSASFVTYAYYRVRGAILDEVRKSWRASNPIGVKFASASKPQQNPSADDQTGGPVEGSTFSTESISSILLAGFTVENIPDSEEDVASKLLRKEELEAVSNAIGELPHRHRYVLQAYYFDDLSLVSISRQLKLSKSRVSRIHAQALSMVRKILQDQRRGNVSNYTLAPDGV